MVMEKVLVRNSSDEEQVKNAERKEKYRDKEEDMDLQFILSTLQGRRFMWRFLSDCGVFKLSFADNALHTAFHEGERNVGLRLFTKINEIDSEAYFKMVKESKNG